MFIESEETSSDQELEGGGKVELLINKNQVSGKQDE